MGDTDLIFDIVLYMKQEEQILKALTGYTE